MYTINTHQLVDLENIYIFYAANTLRTRHNTNKHTPKTNTEINSRGNLIKRANKKIAV